jgi:hypothetical protein
MSWSIHPYHATPAQLTQSPKGLPAVGSQPVLKHNCWTSTQSVVEDRTVVVFELRHRNTPEFLQPYCRPEGNAMPILSFGSARR